MFALIHEDVRCARVAEHFFNTMKRGGLALGDGGHKSITGGRIAKHGIMAREHFRKRWMKTTTPGNGVRIKVQRSWLVYQKSSTQR